VPEDRLRSSEARDHGRALYLRHCALCHGTQADGQGTRREGLSTSPRDFTSAAWQRQVTPRTVFFAIREGVAGTAMPGWKSLEESEAWDLVAFLLSVGEPRTRTKQGRARVPSAEKVSSRAPGTS
jgi:high-affinity iron transporter